jgi:hypothetical protein
MATQLQPSDTGADGRLERRRGGYRCSHRSTLQQRTGNSWIIRQFVRDAANNVLHKCRVVIRQHRDEALVRTLEHRIDRRSGMALSELDGVLDPHESSSSASSVDADAIEVVMSQRWLCAPCSLTALLQGHTVVTGTVTVSTNSRLTASPRKEKVQRTSSKTSCVCHRSGLLHEVAEGRIDHR